MAIKLRSLPFFSTVLLQMHVVFTFTANVSAVAPKHAGRIVDVDVRLLRYLFTDYVPTKPRCVDDGNAADAQDAVPSNTVFLKLHLFQILEVDVVKQTVVLNVDFAMRWKDCRLTWKPEEFENVTEVQVPNKLFEAWIPDISWTEQVDQLVDWHELSAIVVRHSGQLSLATQFQLKSSCSFNLTWYPFDVHDCKVSFNSWLHRMNELNISFMTNEDSRDYFVENDQWHLSMPKLSWHVNKFDGQDFAVAVYRVKIARRPLFHVFNLVIPCTMIMLVCSTVFCIPADSEQKISLALTIQLTLVVFILMMFDKLPDSAESIPLLSKYFASCMIIVSIVCVCTVGIVNIHWRSQCGHHLRIPAYLHTIVTEHLARILLPERLQIIRAQDARQLRTAADGDLLSDMTDFHPPPHGMYNIQQLKSIPHIASYHSLANYDMNRASQNNLDLPNLRRTPPKAVLNSTTFVRVTGGEKEKEKEKEKKKDRIVLSVASEWALIAEVLDRFLLIIFVLVVGIMTFTFLLTGYRNEGCFEDNTC